MIRQARGIHIFSMAALSAVVAACSTPYALHVTDINYKADQRAGPIQYSDPRMFRREALINERNRETEYLDDLIKDSRTLVFTPEIIRDLETISSFAANLGISFNPASGLNYRRDQETSGIQQEIATLRLQMELEQLKRDVELFRTNLASQTTPSQTLGAGTTTSAADVQGNVTPAQTSAMVTQISNLQTALATRLDAARTVLTPSGGTASPIDTFYDRQAYRSVLSSARNAVSLDELHDSFGSALIRLSFTATVLPPPAAYRDALGVLRMEIVPPTWTDETKETLYRLWLGFINREVNRPLPRPRGEGASAAPNRYPGFTADLTLQGLLNSEFFETAHYDYPLSSDVRCRGLSFDEVTQPGCGRLVLALARPVASVGANQSAGVSLESAYEVITSRTGMRRELARANGLLVTGSAGVTVTCNGGNPIAVAAPAAAGEAASLAETRQTSAETVNDAVERAYRVEFLVRAAAEADLQARTILTSAGGEIPPPSAILSELPSNATSLIRDFQERAQVAGCPIGAPRIAIPQRFTDELGREPLRVAVYDIAPREQTQRVSTSARAANALSLAAAVAAQMPSSGVGAEAAAGYSRSATGRADMLERVPLVVAFSEAGDGHTGAGTAFGWLLGPRVSMNSGRNRLELTQQPRPYDLSVDLTVPGWWPYFTLRTDTAWAPNWRRPGAVRTVGQPSTERRHQVPLSTNSADLAALTGRLTRGSLLRSAAIREFVPDRISCRTTTELQIRGPNLWRATAVIIGGRRFDGDRLSVLPDMNGIGVRVANGDFPAASTGDERSVRVSVLTPYGPADLDLPVDDLEQNANTCSKPETRDRQEETPPRPTLSNVSETTISLCGPRPSFAITGQNLNLVTSVRLGGRNGAWNLSNADGTSGVASFPEVTTREAFAGIPRVDLVFGSARAPQAASREITVVQATC